MQLTGLRVTHFVDVGLRWVSSAGVGKLLVRENLGIRIDPPANQRVPAKPRGVVSSHD